MDSDTDSDCELPPGWEKSTLNGEIIYINHINKSTQLVSPMKFLNNDGSYKDMRYSRSCGFSRSRQKTEKFIQKYDSFTTSEQIMGNSNLLFKNSIVIGGCSGIGLEIVHQLIMKNCKVYMGCPSVSKCKSDLLLKIDQESFENLITVFSLDLTTFRSIKVFCQSVLSQISEASFIILAAGVMSPPYTITEDGFESSYQINVLSQFYIQEILLSKFAHSQTQCRVVWLACESHRAVKQFSTSYLNPLPTDYNGLYSYALSNLCKIILISQLKKVWESRYCNKRPLFFACHPGNLVFGTKISRFLPSTRLLFWLFSPFTKTLSQAAATPLLCCISSSLKNFTGCYFNNACLCQPSDIAYEEKHGDNLFQHINDIINQFKDIGFE